MSTNVYDHPDILQHPSRRPADHRLNRFDPDNHFSALSHYSDSPSVYSPSQYSQSHFPDLAHRNDTQLSTLDLEDDPRFSVDVSVYDEDARSLQDDQPQADSDSRLSYLGPKMRFHSRAPWEMDDGILEEVEPVESPKHHHSFPFSLGAKSNQSTGSASPRPSFSRPSGESFRSHLMPKRSFDTINSQMSSKGALYALAQESLSSASLSRPPPQKDGLFGKLSTTLGRARNNSSASSPSSPVLRSQRSYGRVPPLPKHALSDSRDGDYDPFAPNHSRFATIRAPSLTEQDVHPYANPDLVMLGAEPDRDSGYLSSSQLLPARNDSSTTVTQKFEPTTYAASRSSLSSSTGGGRNRISSIHGREISSPVAVQGTSLPPEMSGPGMEGQPVGVSHLPGWKEKFVPPAFSLISLEEARAQRANVVAPPPDDSTPTHSMADLSRSTNSTLNTDDSSSTINHDAMITQGGRTRGRTVSTGAKAKSAFQSMVGSVITDRRDSEPALPPAHTAPVSLPGKPLKHKKSGFMRIFNGGRDKEADASLLPPVPSTVSSDNMLSKKSASRVPVPSYIQPPSDATSILNLSTSSSTFSSSSESSRRVPPSLHINTVSQSPTKRDTSGKKQPRAMTGLSAPKPWENNLPQSAPADVTGFPALKLRPTSGLFSAHFEDIVPDFQSLTMETPTSVSPSGLNFPLTPASSDRFSKPELDLNGKLQTMTTSQRRINELEAQVRALNAELDELRSMQGQHPRAHNGYCESCGRGPEFTLNSARAGSMSSASSSSSSSGSRGEKGHSVVNRPRAKTGTTSRFVNTLA